MKEKTMETILDPALIEACARAAHEANLAYCVAIGDHSQKPWGEAPDWQRESARRGVSLALSGVSPEAQHAAWCADKRADGWAYGAVKDADQKTHPCLVDYAALPEVQKRKDGLYQAVVRAMAMALRANKDAFDGGLSEPEVLGDQFFSLVQDESTLPAEIVCHVGVYVAGCWVLGPQILKMHYLPSRTTPGSREDADRFVNELVDTMRRDTNVRTKDTLYALNVQTRIGMARMLYRCLYQPAPVE